MKKKAQPGDRKRRLAAAGKDIAIPATEVIDRRERSFPIVGLGSSAGGLEALEEFFRQVPKGCDLAFVVVQHLDPTHKGMMAELLQRSTGMRVLQIKDRMKVEPNHVYIIPPNKDLTILHGVLHLLEPTAARGLRLPIDFFFRSLADDRQERSIGVILSGMGSDGTLGLRAIKERAGAVFVQTPASAKFDSMPTMAIDAGLVDVIAPANELPQKIIEYLQHIPLLAQGHHVAAAEKDESALEKIVVLLRAQTGHDFSLYKKTTIYPQQASLSEFPSAVADTRVDRQVSSTAPAKAPLTLNVQAVTDRLLLQRYSPPAVLVTKEGDILYVSGKTGKYLEPAMGQANWNIFAMCREGLSNALAEAFHKAVRKEEVVTLKGLSVRTNGDMQVVDITVHPMTSPETFRGMLMVIFTDVAEPRAPEPPASLGTNATDNSRSTALARELRRARDALQAKVNELSRTSNDLENLLNSTEIATLFLDNTLLVRRFTTRTASVIKLIPADIGRPITDIATTLEYPELAKDIQEVLKTLVFAEKQVYTRDQRWFTVRIMPYRTQENRIDGVVITFADVTLAKNLEAALRKAQADLEERFTRQTTELDQTQKNFRTEINRRPRRNARAGPAPASDHKPRESRHE